MSDYLSPEEHRNWFEGQMSSVNIDRGSEMWENLSEAFGTPDSMKNAINYMEVKDRRMIKQPYAAAANFMMRGEMAPAEMRVKQSRKATYMERAVVDQMVNGVNEWSPTKDTPLWKAPLYHVMGMLDVAGRLSTAPVAAALATIPEAMEMFRDADEGDKEKVYEKTQDIAPWASLLIGVAGADKAIADAATRGVRTLAGMENPAANTVGKSLLHMKRLAAGYKGADADKVAAQVGEVEASVLDRAYNSMRGAMVATIPTQVRNFVNTLYRGGLDTATNVIDDALVNTSNAWKKLYFGRLMDKPYQIQYKHHRQNAAFFKQLGNVLTDPKYADMIDDLAANHKPIQDMLKSYAPDIDPSAAGKFVNRLNTLSSMQEFTVRRAKFLSSLDDMIREEGRLLKGKAFKSDLPDLLNFDTRHALERLGVEALFDKKMANSIPEKMLSKWAAKAADEAMYFTFSKEPGGDLLAQLYKSPFNFMRDHPLGKAISVAGMPFPRFFWNGITAMQDYNPARLLVDFKLADPKTGAKGYELFKIMKLFGAKAISKAEMHEIAQGMTGATVAALFYELRKANISPHWQQIKVGDQTVNFDAMLGPFMIHSLIGDVAYRLENDIDLDYEEFRNLLQGLTEVPGTYEMGIDQTLAAIKDAPDVFKQALEAFRGKSDLPEEGDAPGGTPEGEAAAKMKGVKQVTKFISELGARYLTPLKQISNVIGSFDAEEVNVKSKDSASIINVTPLVNNMPLIRRFLDDQINIGYAPGEAKSPKRPWLVFSGLSPQHETELTEEMKGLSLSFQEREGRKTYFYEYDKMRDVVEQEIMSKFKDIRTRDPLVVVKLKNDDTPFTVHYSGMSNKLKAAFIAEELRAARKESKDVADAYFEKNHPDIYNRIKRDRTSETVRLREAGEELGKRIKKILSEETMDKLELEKAEKANARKETTRQRSAERRARDREAKRGGIQLEE